MNASKLTELNIASSSRREFLRNASVISAGSLLPGARLAAQQSYVTKRPAPLQRKFRSKAVDAAIEATAAKLRDPELAWLFSNCLPNTLDTTVVHGTFEGKPDTMVITGDIPAMWLRDSSAQVWPYLPFVGQDADLARMLEGLIRRQSRCILVDPYANAFMPDLTSREPLEWSVHDHTEMKPGVGERKWEVDSLCYPVRLAYRYWKETRDTSPFDARWAEAMHTVIETFRVQQRKQGRGPYSFTRSSTTPNDTLNGGGFGNPSKPTGLIHSGFRPSDDACVYPMNIPGNFFAVRTLLRLEEMFTEIAHDSATARNARSLADEVQTALGKHATRQHPTAGAIWAYEIDGFGNAIFMDDANVPSLLGLAYMEACPISDAMYQATRKFVLSDANPYFFRGSAAEGVGGPHIGQDMIWPMSIIMRAFTTHDDREQIQCLRWLKSTHAGTGFMHESFHKDDPKNFTRSWFAWANTLFGELILTLEKTSPQVLNAV